MKVAEAGRESIEESVKISILVEYQVYELMAVLEGRERRCESEGTQGKMVVQMCTHTSEPGASSTKAVGQHGVVQGLGLIWEIFVQAQIAF